jgi:hypothetical protein
MENQTSVEEKSDKNRTFVIAAIAAVAVIVLCCCCIVLAGAGYYFFATNRSAVAPVLPEEDFTPSNGFDSSEPPSGGLANDILKNDTWAVMSPAAESFGCEQPSGSGLSIEVLQEPDASGVWVEKWPVMCASGETIEFEVEFILDDTGATFNIRLAE